MKLAYLLIAALSLPALAMDFEIKGIRIGMTKAELQAAHPGLDCSESCYHIGKSRRNNVPTLETLAGSKVSSWWFAFSKDEKLARSYVVLPISSASIVTTAFMEKFGRPTREEKGEFKTAGGYSGDKLTITWSDGDVSLVVTSPSGKINEMRVEMYSKAFIDTEVESRKAKAKQDL